MIYFSIVLRIFAAVFIHSPMKEQKSDSHEYKLLVHCRFSQLREGFEEYVRSLPFPCQMNCTNLADDGILFKLRYSPHLIVVLLSEADSEFNLPLKIKLFAPDVPLLLILPSIPVAYYDYLKASGVDEIIQLPMNKANICRIITEMFAGR